MQKLFLNKRYFVNCWLLVFFLLSLPIFAKDEYLDMQVGLSQNKKSDINDTFGIRFGMPVVDQVFFDIGYQFRSYQDDYSSKPDPFFDVGIGYMHYLNNDLGVYGRLSETYNLENRDERFNTMFELGSVYRISNVFDFLVSSNVRERGYNNMEYAFAIGFRYNFNSDNLSLNLNVIQSKEVLDDKLKETVYEDTNKNSLMVSANDIVKSNVVHSIVRFDFDSYRVKCSSIERIDEMLDLLNSNKNLNVRLVGHADHLGKPKYNYKLSLFRSSSVAECFYTDDIDNSRIFIEGKGSENMMRSDISTAAEYRIVEIYID